MSDAASSLEALFRTARDETPKSLPKDSWYILVAATLITADGGKHVGDLWNFIMKDLGSGSTPEARHNVSQRLRAVILKSWTLAGMPRASDAFFALKRVEPEEDSAREWDRREFAAAPERAMERRNTWWGKVFKKEETARIENSYPNEEDFSWTVDFVIYGLFLGDESVLADVENELVTLSLVMGQGAYYTTLVHLKGTRRIGVGAKDAENVQRVIEAVAQYLGKDTASWPRFKEVEDLFP